MSIDNIGLDWGQSYRFQQEIDATLDWLGELASKASADVEIRLTDILPTITILSTNPNLNNGIMPAIPGVGLLRICQKSKKGSQESHRRDQASRYHQR